MQALGCDAIAPESAQSRRLDGLLARPVRVVYIVPGVHFNLNLRELHDAIYREPDPDATVRFVVHRDAVILSRSADLPAMRSGVWSARLTGALDLRLENHGRIQGKGGAGGAGGNPNGSAGADGGDAFFAEYPISVDNTDGKIWAGGGGGGAGGEGDSTGGFAIKGAGAPGGGGAGTDGGAAGAYGDGAPGTASADGTADAGGAAGIPLAGYGGGKGGDGGDPGLAGSTGAAGTGSVVHGTGGDGGAPGDYVIGNALVTWIATGDVRGGVS